MRQYVMLMLLGGLAVAALGGIAVALRQSGYDDGYAKASAECAAERARLEEATRNAIRSAEQQLLRTADELATTTRKLDDALAETDAATAADPHGADQCLDALGLRRLNAIR